MMGDYAAAAALYEAHRFPLSDIDCDEHCDECREDCPLAEKEDDGGRMIKIIALVPTLCGFTNWRHTHG